MSEKESQQTPKRNRRLRTWEEAYADLKAFEQQHGHTRPNRATLVGQWAGRQRKKRLDNELSDHQIQLLDKIGFNWESKSDQEERQWEEMLDLLIVYKDMLGDSCVTQKETFRGLPLGAWVYTQRRRYRENKLKPCRQEKMESIGFQWVPKGRPVRKPPSPSGKVDEKWRDKFKVLCEYKDRIGDTLPPCGYKGTLTNGVTFDLGHFVKLQRQKYRDGFLRHDRYERLNQIGFVFTVDLSDTRTSKTQHLWDKMYERLCLYRREHGNCEVPRYYNVDGELGIWVNYQRQRYAKGELGETRVQRLDKIGFAWSVVALFTLHISCLRTISFPLTCILIM